MADDLVNQLTLNFLISKNQLYKLNKKIKESNDVNKKNNKEIYKERITKLFNELLENNPPNDLLFDVKSGFDYFVDKCVYYFKTHDDNANLNRYSNNDDNDLTNGSNNDDNDLTNGSNNDDNDSNNDSNNDDSNNDDNDLTNDSNNDDSNNDDNDLTIDLEPAVEQPIIVKEKYTNKSSGHSDMQKLPLNWFQSVRQNYKQNHIIPRTKDVIIGGNSAFRDEKKKI
jgi:hypothetical protein